MNRRLLILSGIVSLAFTIAANGSNMTAAMTVDRRTVYEKETFTLTLTVVATGFQFGQEMSLSPFTTNSAFQLTGKGQFQEKSVKQMPGKAVRQFRCRAQVLKPGRVALAPVFSAMLEKKESHMFGYQWIRQQEQVSITPLVIDVRPLPAAGRPGNFSGAVGRFSFVASVTPTNPVPGDLITLRSRIKGDGELNGINPPRVSPGKDFKVYDPETVEGSTAYDLAIDQILIPQSTNAGAIPAISFSYFDPTARSYRTINRGPFELTFRDPSSDPVEAYIPPAINDDTEDEGDVNRSPPQKLSFADKVRGLLKSYPTAVVINNARGRLVPAPSALETFELPENSVVEVLELSGDWARVSSGNRRGWIPLHVLTLE